MRPAIGWRRRLHAGVTERLGLKAMALVLAIVLWAIVSLKDQTEALVIARLLPITAPGMELAGPTPRVRVLVRGLGRELFKLHQTPPVIRWRLPLTAVDQVTLEVLPAHVSLPPDVTADVEEVVPRFVTVRVRRVTATGAIRSTAPTEARASEPAVISPLVADTSARDTTAPAAIVPAPADSQR